MKMDGKVVKMRVIPIYNYIVLCSTPILFKVNKYVGACPSKNTFLLLNMRN